MERQAPRAITAFSLVASYREGILVFHYVNNVLGVDGNRRTYALKDWQVEVVLPGTDTVVPIYAADSLSSPIGAVSGVANRALSDEFGMVSFWVPVGQYDIKQYTPVGSLERRVEGLDMYGAAPGTYVQETQPSGPGPYLWLKTDGTPRARLFIEDGI